MKLHILAAYEDAAQVLFGGDRLPVKGPDWELSTVSYGDWDELVAIVEANRLSFDGLLLDSDLALEYLTSQNTLQGKSFQAIAPSDADLMGLLIGRLLQNPPWDLSRILIDAGDCGNAFDGFLPIERRPVVVSGDVWGGDDPNTWVDGALHRYQDAWASGCFDLIITRRIPLVGRLSLLGMRAWGVGASDKTVKNILNTLLYRVRARLLGELLPVCAVVGTFGGPGAIDSLGEALDRFNEQQGRQMPVLRRSGVFEMELCNRRLSELTDGHRVCPLMQFLQDNLTQSASVGWGVGTTMAQARSHAVRAYRESMFDRSGYSYLVDDEGRMLGPLAAGNALQRPGAARLRHQEEMARRSGLTLTSVQKLQAALARTGARETTSGELAQGLNITQRSAARILARLAACGLAEHIPQGELAVRGRPAKKYRLHL
jgi:hypothetical protein